MYILKSFKVLKIQILKEPTCHFMELNPTSTIVDREGRAMPPHCSPMKIDQEKDLVCWTFYRIYFCFSTISKMCPKQPIPFLIVDITYQYHIFKLMRDLCPDHPILVDSLDFQFKLPSWSCMWVLRGFLPILVSNRRTLLHFLISS